MILYYYEEEDCNYDCMCNNPARQSQRLWSDKIGFHYIQGSCPRALTSGFSISGSLSETDKPIGDHNPIASNVFFADPTSVEYEGRLYVYGTCDQQEYDAKGGFGDNSYGAINTLACYSTDDMVNWTYHE